MTFIRSAVAALFASGLLLAGGASVTQAQDWWPIKVFDLDGLTADEFDQLETSARDRRLRPAREGLEEVASVCVVPAYEGQLLGECELWRHGRGAPLGVKATLFSAGGYTELNKQVSQFDDCMALNPGRYPSLA